MIMVLTFCQQEPKKKLLELLTTLKQASKTGLVFPSSEGIILKERRTLAMCKAVAKRAGIRSNAYIHKFRHTYATILVREGVRLEDIKALLGHSSIEETERYAHHTPEFLHDKVSKLDQIF